VRLLITLLCSLILPLTASAQIPTATGLQGADFLAPVSTIAKSVDEVNLAFTVTDKHGRFISNLRPDDFRLFDNNAAPERLTFFQQRSDLPLHLAVVIDASASVEYRFKFETSAAAEFLKNVLRPGTDRAFVVAFNDRVRTVVEPSDRPAKLTAALKRLKPEGNTDLNGAVIYACEKLRQISESQITRRAIVLLSDGVDTVHSSTLQQAEQAASRAQVMLFSLTTNESQLDANSDGDKVLRELAQSTGGALLAADNEGRLAFAFKAVEKALRNQYILGYTPTDFSADGSYRKVELHTIKHGLHTNCRKGYYAKSRVGP
jgi:Ca-activated chloride channel homolog